MRRTHWLLAALAGLSLTVTGCATSAPTASTKSAYNTIGLGDRVLIDRDTVIVNGPRSVLELLEGRVARFRFSANALGKSPLVVVDDVALVDGFSALSMMRASDVQRVEILWPTEAAFRYGSSAGHGAIVIKTRTGRPQPDAS
jgi:hypothetical protein